MFYIIHLYKSFCERGKKRNDFRTFNRLTKYEFIFIMLQLILRCSIYFRLTLPRSYNATGAF